MKNRSQKLLETIESVTEAEVIKTKVISNRALDVPKDKDEPVIELGFVTGKGKEKVAFTPNTKLQGFKSLKDVKIGQKVEVEVEKTSRGPHAKSMKKI